MYINRLFSGYFRKTICLCDKSVNYNSMHERIILVSETITELKEITKKEKKKKDWNATDQIVPKRRKSMLLATYTQANMTSSFHIVYIRANLQKVNISRMAPIFIKIYPF